MREVACVNAAVPQSSHLKYPPFLFPLCSGTALAIACCSSHMQMYILQSQDALHWGSRLLSVGNKPFPAISHPGKTPSDALHCESAGSDGPLISKVSLVEIQMLRAEKGGNVNL